MLHRAPGFALALLVALPPGSTPLFAAGEAAANGRHDFLLDGPRLDLPWNERGAFSLGGLASPQAPDAFAQDVYVVPQKPGKNQVRYFDFQWLDFDYLDDDGSAGIRLYYYDREYKSLAPRPASCARPGPT